MSEDQNNQEANFKVTPVQPFELKFSNINVVATVEEKVEVAPGKFKKEKVQKTILNKVSGIFAPNTFSAIVGPSGCGKTTMLNLLSGRLLSENLSLDGELHVNGKECHDITHYESMIGYIMQEDLLMATFTPRESFRFVADLRLIESTEEEKTERVEELIQILGLAKCADTYVGNTMIRGLSGGEKRRCSIGVELLTNPSMIFLDEPTTGLDSTTSLHLMQFLNKIAKSGRTIVSTIHQPSSEIFDQFDRLLIMVQGNIVYQGQAKDSMKYFKNIGFPIKTHSNPTDYYMRIMNKEGLSLEYLEKGEDIDDKEVKRLFEDRVNYFKDKYNQQPHSFDTNVSTEIVKGHGQGNLNFFGQVYYIMKRTVKNQIRNPLDVGLRIFQMVIQGAFCAILYYKESDTSYATIQNVTGCLSFLLMTIAFSGAVSNISTFSTERSVFIRERMNNTYSTISYFIGRNVAYLPLEWLLPLIFILFGYFSSHLNNNAGTFFLQLLVLELTYWMSASYGLVISTAIKQFDVALALIPVLIIPLMLVSGFFVSLEQVPKFFYWLEYLSMFKYGYQAMITNQYNHPVDCGNGVFCDILETRFKFPDAQWLNYFLLAFIGIVFRIFAYIALEMISSPKRIKLGHGKGNHQPKTLAPYAGIPAVPQSAQILQPRDPYTYPVPASNTHPALPPSNPNPPHNHDIPPTMLNSIRQEQIQRPRIVGSSHSGSSKNSSRIKISSHPSRADESNPSPSNIKLAENLSKLAQLQYRGDYLAPAVSESISQLNHNQYH